MWQPKITATHLLGFRRNEFASSPCLVTTDGTGNALLSHSSDERQIFVKDLVHRWDISHGWSGRGAAKTWVAGGHRKIFPVQEAASWVSFCMPGRCHTVCDDEAHGEEPTGQSRAALGPRGVRPGPGHRSARAEGRWRSAPHNAGWDEVLFQGSYVGVFETPEQSQNGRLQGFLSGAKGVAP